MRLTRAQYNEVQMRLNPQEVKRSEVDIEADLHKQIIAHCEQMGWVYLHGDMRHKTRRTPGEPDFHIYTKGRYWLIECKTQTGELSPAQKLLFENLGRLGQKVFVVRSMQEFLEVVR